MEGLDIMLKWFKTAHTLEDVKHTYRTLCKQYHPDIHGAATEEIMKEINAEYERAFNHYKNIHADTEGNTYTACSQRIKKLGTGTDQRTAHGTTRR